MLIAVPCLYHFHLYIQTKEKQYNQQKKHEIENIIMFNTLDLVPEH